MFLSNHLDINDTVRDKSIYKTIRLITSLICKIFQTFNANIYLYYSSNRLLMIYTFPKIFRKIIER